MATLTFPLGLPTPYRETFSSEIRMGLRRTEMDGQNARQRRIMDTMPQRMSLTWQLSVTQFKVFMFFMKQHGGEFFRVQVPSMDGTGRLTEVTARLISNISHEVGGSPAVWTATAEFEVLTGDPPAAGDLAGWLLQEDGFLLLQEDGSRIALEFGNSFYS